MYKFTKSNSIVVQFIRDFSVWLYLYLIIIYIIISSITNFLLKFEYVLLKRYHVFFSSLKKIAVTCYLFIYLFIDTLVDVLNPLGTSYNFRFFFSVWFYLTFIIPFLQDLKYYLTKIILNRYMPYIFITLK